MLEGRVTLPKLPLKNIVLGNESAELAVLVLRSGILDPGKAGYWITFSANDGIKWTPPLYTGLVENEPFKVLPYTHFPVIEEGNIRLEAHNRKKSVNKNGEKIIWFLSIPLDVLRKDADSDGLTDLMEEKLLTDPRRPDTDGDTVSDIIDAAPLAPRMPRSDYDMLRVAALENILEKTDKIWIAEAAQSGLIIMKIKTAGEIHNYPGSKAKIIHLNKKDIRRYTRKFNDRAVFEFRKIEISGASAVVVWSRRDVEKKIDFTRHNGKWIPLNRK